MALNGHWNIFDGPITPYLGGSIGVTMIDTNVLAGIDSGCWWVPWWGLRCGRWPVTYGETTASYTLGGGFRFQLTDNFFIRAGYERGWISSGDVDGTNMFRIDLGMLMGPYLFF